MPPVRRRRLLVGLLLLATAGAATALVLYALRENLNLFYTPADFAAGKVPLERTVHLGGLVERGSIERDVSGLHLRFRVSDFETQVPVAYTGLLPDLFAEGRGAVATGQLGADGVFQAVRILAKHDENYQPPGMPMPEIPPP